MLMNWTTETHSAAKNSEETAENKMFQEQSCGKNGEPNSELVTKLCFTIDIYVLLIWSSSDKVFQMCLLVSFKSYKSIFTKAMNLTVAPVVPVLRVLLAGNLNGNRGWQEHYHYVIRHSMLSTVAFANREETHASQSFQKHLPLHFSVWAPAAPQLHVLCPIGFFFQNNTSVSLRAAPWTVKSEFRVEMRQSSPIVSPFPDVSKHHSSCSIALNYLLKSNN